MSWSELIVIDHPDTVELSPAARATLDAMAGDVANAELDWKLELSAYGVEPGDADLYRRAANVAIDRAAHQLCATTPDWLTTWIGTRPTDAPGATVWDDTAHGIARHRLLHDIPEHQPGLGSRPSDQATADGWQEAMIGVLDDRCWLIDRQPIVPAAVTVRMSIELISRQTELQRLLSTAPVDQRELIERITNSALAPAQMHKYLTVAAKGQGERRDWIVANWPYIVELEQINSLIASQPAVVHSPAVERDPMLEMLNQLRLLAPTLDGREQRTLAELDRQAGELNPVPELEARAAQLEQLAQSGSSGEQEAVHEELVNVGAQLRQARRERAADQVFDRYQPNPIDDARATRIATLAHDVLTTQPAWIKDHVRQLHDEQQLTSSDPVELATRIIQVAAHLDLHGQLPATWPTPVPAAVSLSYPSIELGY